MAKLLLSACDSALAY